MLEHYNSISRWNKRWNLLVVGLPLLLAGRPQQCLPASPFLFLPQERQLFQPATIKSAKAPALTRVRAPASNFLLNKPIADKKEEPHLKWCGSSFYDGFIYRSACWLCSSFGIAFAIRNPASAVKPTSGAGRRGYKSANTTHTGFCPGTYPPKSVPMRRSLPG